jgi:hypothetical protein
MKFLSGLVRKGPAARPVVVVSGLPRSGTSMLMRMLDAGGIPPLTDELRSADDDNPRGYYEFEPVKKLREGDSSWLPQAQGKAVKIISALLAYLPPTQTYQVLFIQRAIPEILASQRKMLVNRGEDPDKVSDAEMAQYFEKHLAQVTAWLGEQKQVRTLYVDYNQMLHDPAPTARKINAFLGGNLEVEKMVAVVDPALYRQRKAENP